jgi:hypothetical protein
MPSPDRADAVA